LTLVPSPEPAPFTKPPDRSFYTSINPAMRGLYYRQVHTFCFFDPDPDSDFDFDFDFESDFDLDR